MTNASAARLLAWVVGVMCVAGQGPSVIGQTRATSEPAGIAGIGLYPGDGTLREEDRRIQAALDVVVPEVSFEQIALPAFMKWVAQQQQINVELRSLALDDVGVDRPVTVHMRGLPLWRVLRSVLDQAGGGDVRLGYEVRDGVLIVATQESLGRELITRVYPVRDLLAALAARELRLHKPAAPRAAVGPSAADLAKATDPTYREQAAVRSAATTRPSEPTNDAEERALVVAEERFCDVVEDTIEPDAWCKHGGDGMTRFCNGVMVVHQSRGVHRQIERLLTELRAGGAADMPR